MKKRDHGCDFTLRDPSSFSSVPSIYKYLEDTLHMTIVNSKRIMTVEKITQIDEKYLHINADDYNCMAVISSQTFNSDGVMFEFTQSRHRPDYFRFQDNAVRKVEK